MEKIEQSINDIVVFGFFLFIALALALTIVSTLRTTQETEQTREEALS